MRAGAARAREAGLAWAAGAAWRESARRVPGAGACIPGPAAPQAHTQARRRARSTVARRARSTAAPRFRFQTVRPVHSLMARRVRFHVVRPARSMVVRPARWLVSRRVRFLLVRRGRSSVVRWAHGLAARPPGVPAGRWPKAEPASPTGRGPAEGTPPVPVPGPDRPVAEGNAAGAAWAISPPAARRNSATAVDSDQQAGPRSSLVNMSECSAQHLLFHHLRQLAAVAIVTLGRCHLGRWSEAASPPRQNRVRASRRGAATPGVRRGGAARYERRERATPVKGPGEAGAALEASGEHSSGELERQGALEATGGTG